MGSINKERVSRASMDKLDIELKRIAVVYEEFGYIFDNEVCEGDHLYQNIRKYKGTEAEIKGLVEVYTAYIRRNYRKYIAGVYNEVPEREIDYLIELLQANNQITKGAIVGIIKGLREDEELKDIYLEIKSENMTLSKKGIKSNFKKWLEASKEHEELKKDKNKELREYLEGIGYIGLKEDSISGIKELHEKNPNLSIGEVMKDISDALRMVEVMLASKLEGSGYSIGLLNYYKEGGVYSEEVLSTCIKCMLDEDGGRIYEDLLDDLNKRIKEEAVRIVDIGVISRWGIEKGKELYGGSISIKVIEGAIGKWVEDGLIISKVKEGKDLRESKEKKREEDFIKANEEAIEEEYIARIKSESGITIFSRKQREKRLYEAISKVPKYKYGEVYKKAVQRLNRQLGEAYESVEDEGYDHIIIVGNGRKIYVSEGYIIDGERLKVYRDTYKVLGLREDEEDNKLLDEMDKGMRLREYIQKISILKNEIEDMYENGKGKEEGSIEGRYKGKEIPKRYSEKNKRVLKIVEEVGDGLKVRVSGIEYRGEVVGLKIDGLGYNYEISLDKIYYKGREVARLNEIGGVQETQRGLMEVAKQMRKDRIKLVESIGELKKVEQIIGVGYDLRKKVQG